MASTDTGFGFCRLFDDFLGDALNDDMWTVAESGNGDVFVINTQVNGAIRGTVTDNSSSDIEVIYGAVNWQADDAGPLVFECRIKPETSLEQMIFVGFSDEATAELPFKISSGTVTSAADNGAGIYYAGGESTPVWRCGGTKAGSDSAQTAASSIYNPVLSTFQTLKVVLDADGRGNFYVNGVPIAENVPNCVTASTSLCPFIANSDDGAAASIDVDYILVTKGRV